MSGVVDLAGGGEAEDRRCGWRIYKMMGGMAYKTPGARLHQSRDLISLPITQIFFDNLVT
jgi:hypothetical protein